MTDPETRAIPVDVVQVDRDAADAYLVGEEDERLVQAFARHRTTALETLAAERDAWQTRAAEHHRSIDAIHTRATAAETRAETLAAENARLREALEPFAACADELDGTEWTPRAPNGEWAKFRLLTDDYRRARAALSPVTQVKESGRG